MHNATQPVPSLVYHAVSGGGALVGKPCRTVRDCMAQSGLPARVDIRADYTSDGTYQGLGRGRIEAERRASHNTPGGWIVESYPAFGTEFFTR